MKGYKNVGLPKQLSMKIRDKKKYVPQAKTVSGGIGDFAGSRRMAGKAKKGAVFSV